MRLLFFLLLLNGLFNPHLNAGDGSTCVSPEFTGIPQPASTDCSHLNTTISDRYDTDFEVEIPVVWHVISRSDGVGDTSLEMILTQMEILNEDFRAITGTPGGLGTDTAVSFYLADVDPDGEPTTGITRTVNNAWYSNADVTGYKTALGWDQSRYLNIYTNNGGGALGATPIPSAGGVAGDIADGIVMLWRVIGRDAPTGPPFDQGRSLTHHLGHYLGLYHIYDLNCCNDYDCNDLIVDTPAQTVETLACTEGSSCGSDHLIENYMDNTFDECMTGFTPEQTNRMRCTLLNFRPLLYNFTAEHPCTDAPPTDIYPNWLSFEAHYDYNGDNTVDLIDLVQFANLGCTRF